MKLPYTKKAEMNVRAGFRGTVPWLLGKFSIDEEGITLKYFFMSKRIKYGDIKRVKTFDNFLELSLEKSSYQIRLGKAEELKEMIEKKIK